MPKARYLAPWHQEDLVEAWKKRVEEAGVGDMDAEAMDALRGKPAIYHCISRVVDRRFAFGDVEREKFVGLMRRYERFCEVRVLAYCVMSNHFHILLEVPVAPPARGGDWSDGQFLDHLACLYPEEQVGEIRWQLELFRRQKADAAAAEFRDGFFARMWDLSQFMKLLKLCFTRWINRKHERQGTLWEERFKSVLVEDGHAARVVAAYIDLNPVRAEMVSDPKDYRWCSYGEAMAGKQRAREGIQRVMCESEGAWGGGEKAVEVLLSWRAAARRYREVLYAYLRRGAGVESEGVSVMATAEALGDVVRAFNDGLAVGRPGFLEAVYGLTRDRFGPNRKNGARKIRGVGTELRAMRDLRGGKRRSTD